MINQELQPEHRSPFTYQDQGILATICRAQAIAQIEPFHASGPVARALWCIVHVFFLIVLRNRVHVMSEWTWHYLTIKPGARLFFEQPAVPCNPSSNDHVCETTDEDRAQLRRAA